jgi:nicotinamide-nucleotide amidase
MEASIITVGDEILIGQIVDTNSAWMGQQLNAIGIDVREILSVGDRHEEIIRALNEVCTLTDIVLITGGLGPTDDDLTIAALADFLGVGLYFDAPTYERIKSYFERLGRPISDAHKAQCYLPETVEILKNKMGTAPGMLFRHKNKIIISMPGVPYEMKYLMEHEVLPFLQSNFVSDIIIHKTIMTAGEGESVLAEMIAPIVKSFPPHLKMAYLPALGMVRLRITAKGKHEISLRQEVLQYAEEITAHVGDAVFGYDDVALEQVIRDLCIKKALTLSTAESCTGGAIAARLTTIAGSSEYFKGSIIAYSNQIKELLLNVPGNILTAHGAVSETTVKAMASGVLKVINTDLAVAVSGIAGPDGGSPEKPVGTIWVAIANSTITEATLIRAGKDRLKNIEYTVNIALNLLRKFIEKHY